jgi:hypothetical protein
MAISILIELTAVASNLVVSMQPLGHGCLEIEVEKSIEYNIFQRLQLKPNTVQDHFNKTKIYSETDI